MVGFQDYVNADEEHFLETLANLETLVGRITDEAIFSPNETLGEIQTEHMKMLMVPYLEAEVLNRLMDTREERVRQAHVYYLEYLKLMRHYDLLEKPQTSKLKNAIENYKAQIQGAEDDELSKLEE